MNRKKKNVPFSDPEQSPTVSITPLVIDTAIGQRHHATIDVVDELLNDGAIRVGDGDDALSVVQLAIQIYLKGLP